MRSPVRRSLVLATLLALLLGVVGAAPRRPPSQASRRPTTRVAGINVDATTIPQLERLMNRHRLTSVQLVQFYLHRIKKLNPKLHAVITVSPTALARARAADKARRHGDPAAAPRDPGDRQGQRRHDRHADDRRLVGARGQPAPRRVHRPAAAGGRRDHHRQGEPVRVGELPVRLLVERLERHRRPDEHGLRPRSQPVRLELRLRRRGLGRSRDRRASAPRPTARSSARPARTASSASSRRSGCWSRAGIVPISADQDTAGPMARNVTDAAVVLGAVDGHRPERRRDRRPGRPRVHATTPSSSTSTRSRAPGSASGARARTTRRSAPRSTRSSTTPSTMLKAPGRDRRRPDADPDRARLRARVHRAALRVQERHRVLPADVHRGALSRRRSRT